MDLNQTWNYIPHNILVKIFSNLSHVSRAKASATCKAWREAYSSPCLWDNIQLSYDSSHGWERCKNFVSSCGHLFRQVSIFPLIFYLNIFDTNGYLLHDAAEMYEKAVQELPELLDLMETSQCLHRLQIKFPDDTMGSWGDNYDIDFFPGDIQDRIWQSICTILKSSQFIENLELGFQINILGDPKRLQVLKDTCSQTLKTLNCTVVDLTFNEAHPWLPPSINNLMAFKKLKEVNLNISYVTNDLLQVFSAPDHCQMEKIGILSTCIERQVEDETWISDIMWQKLKEHSPGLQVSICMYWPGIDKFKQILKPVMPLCSLSVMCDDEKLNPMFVDYVKAHFKNTLVILGLHSYTALSLFQHERMRLYSQPLLELAEHCLELKRLIITGFEIFHEDIISIAEVRRDLEILDIAHDSVIYMDPERGDRSSDLGEDWLAHRDDDEESLEERENREQRDTRKDRLICRVSHAFQKKWKPMNRETSALSYWGFLDDNILPYKENTDNDDDDDDVGNDTQEANRPCHDNNESTSKRIEHTIDSTRRRQQDGESGVEHSNKASEAEMMYKGDDGHLKEDDSGDNDKTDGEANIGNRQIRETYKEYHHAIHLAPGLIACKVKPINKL